MCAARRALLSPPLESDGWGLEAPAFTDGFETAWVLSAVSPVLSIVSTLGRQVARLAQTLGQHLWTPQVLAEGLC